MLTDSTNRKCSGTYSYLHVYFRSIFLPVFWVGCWDCAVKNCLYSLYIQYTMRHKYGATKTPLILMLKRPSVRLYMEWNGNGSIWHIRTYNINMDYIIVFNFYSFSNFTLGIRSLKKQKSKLIMIFQSLGDFLPSDLNLRYSFEFSERFAKPFRGTAHIRNLVLLRSASSICNVI